jgi:ferric-dicitrate binding protein FerR (iron transport regulator)
MVCVGNFFLRDGEKKKRSYVVVTPQARFEFDEGAAMPIVPSGQIEKKLAAQLKPADIEPVALPDGSTILLNTDGEVRYATDFSVESREVIVKGEAFFDVKPDDLKPFRVRAGNIVATVAGTSFDVKTVGDEVVITVLHGQVRIGDDTHDLGEVNANQQMVVNTKTLEHFRRQIPPGEEMFWETKYLFLGEVSFGEAMRRVGRRFDVRIDVANPELRNCTIHTNIPPSEDVMDIVTIISKSVNAHVVKKRDRIKIVGGSCPSR